MFCYQAWDYEPMTTFKAVIEPDLPGAFLTRSPRKPPLTKLVPWLTGLNTDEGCLKSVCKFSLLLIFNYVQMK